jgi:uncharacterized metal-binding protein YceD (DUF177 family)
MNALVEYSIPIKGIANGVHQFEYQIDHHFLKHFEESPITDAAVQVQFELEKKPGLFALHFDISGTVKTTCDRCLASIHLPITGKERLLVKISLEEESDDPEVVYLHPEATKLEVAGFIYEFVILAIPMIKTYDCESQEPLPCNEEMLDRLYEAEESSNEEEESNSNSVWEELKKFNSNK